MDAAAVRCTDLVKRYGEVAAVNGVDLTVEPGEIMALLGPSGCGKTTLLRLVAGFETPDAGVVEIGGETVAAAGASLPPEKRQVGMVFQSYALFPHLSVAENIAFGLGRTKDSRRQVESALALVGLTGLGERMVDELSGGQQQRVALMRALAPRPRALMLDEPFSNLDARHRVRMREEVRAILKTSGIATVFVTHDQEEALFMGDRVAVQNEGRIEQVGTPEEVFGAPATRFVAEFIGQTDFLPGEVTAEGVQTEVGLLLQPVELSVGAAVDVAVRADDVHITPDAAAGGIVLNRFYRGMVSVYRVRLPSGRLLHSMQSDTVRIPPITRVRVELQPGHPLACFASDSAA